MRFQGFTRLLLVVVAASGSACALVLGDFDTSGTGNMSNGGSGACTDEPDLGAMAASAGTIVNDTINCVLQSNGDKGQASGCIQATDALSQGCADCYAIYGGCGLALCMSPCAAGANLTSSACSACLQANCDADFIACSGLPCALDQALCDGTCVDTSSDPNNCGACGVPCNGTACVDSACTATCQPEGGACGPGTPCCSGSCQGAVCSCTPPGMPCSMDADCCDAQCLANFCE